MGTHQPRKTGATMPQYGWIFGTIVIVMLLLILLIVNGNLSL